jgi:hypothetical protein
MCQDTGTAIVKGKKGQFVFTGGGDRRVLQEVECDEAVVVGRFGIIEDLGELFEVAGAQVVRNVAHRFGCQAADCLRFDLEERSLWCVERRNALRGDEPVLGFVGPQREHLGVVDLRVSHSAQGMRSHCAWHSATRRPI